MRYTGMEHWCNNLLVIRWPLHFILFFFANRRSIFNYCCYKRHVYLFKTNWLIIQWTENCKNCCIFNQILNKHSKPLDVSFIFLNQFSSMQIKWQAIIIKCNRFQKVYIYLNKRSRTLPVVEICLKTIYFDFWKVNNSTLNK